MGLTGCIGAPLQEKLTWMYSQPINLNTDDDYLMGKEKEPEKEDEELKKVRLLALCVRWLRARACALQSHPVVPSAARAGVGPHSLTAIRLCARPPGGYQQGG
jgi:hypothetical protein